MSKRSAPKEKPSPRKRVAVEGVEIPDRVLVIRFDELWEMLAAPPDTAAAEEERLLSGIDLLGGLLDGGENFGHAAPGELEDFAARVLSLTDDAFSAAYEILDDTDYERAYGAPPAYAKAFLRRAATDLLDDALFGEDPLLGFSPPERRTSALYAFEDDEGLVRSNVARDVVHHAPPGGPSYREGRSFGPAPHTPSPPRASTLPSTPSTLTSPRQGRPRGRRVPPERRQRHRLRAARGLRPRGPRRRARGSGRTLLPPASGWSCLR